MFFFVAKSRVFKDLIRVGTGRSFIYELYINNNKQIS